jgi:hypothetical protein
LTYRAALRKSGQSGLASQPPRRRVPVGLGVLFPQAPQPEPGLAGVTRSLRWRAGYVAIQVAAVCAGVVALLPRIGGVPSWDSVYAEDQGEFLVDALARPWHLLVPFGGYEELMPRVIGQLVSYLPLMDAAVAFALAGAGIAALCALFIFHAMDGWVRSGWLRALVGAALILLPLAPIEIADSGVNSPWYALAALFFGLLWRPKGWAGMTAAALVAFAASSSEILAVIYAPLVLLRLVALPRWREHAVTAGWLAGLLVQVPVVVESYARHTQRLGTVARPGRAVGFYFHNVALRAFGWRVSLHLVRAFGLNGATLIVCAILMAMFGWALVSGNRHSRAFVAVALIMGFAEAVFAATVVPLVIDQQYFFDFEGGSRYTAMPIMAMTAAAAVAVDAYLRRRARDPQPDAAAGDRIPHGGQRRRAIALIAALACVLAVGWVPDYRYPVTERIAWGHWQPEAQRLLTACEHSTSGEITTWTWGSGTITIPCSRLRG